MNFPLPECLPYLKDEIRLKVQTTMTTILKTSPVKCTLNFLWHLIPHGIRCNEFCVQKLANEAFGLFPLLVAI